VAASTEAGDAPTSSRVAVVAGLFGVAVTQPLLDLFGRNPTFFTAGPYGRGQIVLFALVVAIVPTAVVAACLILISKVRPQAGRVAYRALVVVLGALFGNVLIRGLGLDGAWLAVVATVVGSVVAALVESSRPGRLLLQYLALGNLLFLGGFLFISPTSVLLGGSGGDDLGTVTVPTPPGPVVVVILDEFPVTTLMRSDGSINADRFPGFAELAARSTWYRNASVQHHSTPLAVPTLLTGVLAQEGQVPTYRDHPRNLFTLVGGQLPISAFEPVTTLCPPDLCDPRPQPSLVRALADAAVVYGHRVLPPALRASIPEIDSQWGGFGGAVGNGPVAELPEGLTDDPDHPFLKLSLLAEDQRGPVGQAGVLAARTASITAEPALEVIHVLLPHVPWILSRTGTHLFESPPRVEDPTDPAYPWSSRQRFQLHSMQAGAADVAITDLIDHLDEIGVWDDTTLVVVSDHGVGTSGLPELHAPDFGRQATSENNQELHRIPLFIHSPKLAEGAVVDDSAQSIDLLPTLVDLLGIQTSWTFDGHSLVDGSASTVAPLVGADLAPALAVVRRHEAEFPHGDTWTALAAVGDHGDLVGQPVTTLPVGEPSAMRWTLDHADQLGDLPTAAGEAPQLLTGVVSSPSAARPPELLVVVNGTVAGVAGGFEQRKAGWRFTAFLGPYLREGANSFEAYEVGSAAGAPLLHRVG